MIRLLVLILLLGPCVGNSFAQYFGRNRVQYETFDYRVLTTDRFDVHYTADEFPPNARSIHDAGRMAHVFQYDIAKDTAAVQRGLQAMARLPLWFVEGIGRILLHRIRTHADGRLAAGRPASRTTAGPA